MRGELPKKVYQTVLDIVYPRTCPICGKITGKGAKICPNCRNGLIYLQEPRCKKCSKALTTEEAEYCYDCSRTEHSYDTGISVFSYNKAMRESVTAFKYHNKREYADFYVDEICNRYRNLMMTWKADGIIPVPIHKSKLTKRGFNQATLLARGISGTTGIPVYEKYLIRTKKTTPQKELNNRERKKNLKKAFLISDNNVKLNSVIIVDDIYTTGSTVDACAELLKEAGVEKVYFISLCIGTGY